MKKGGYWKENNYQDINCKQDNIINKPTSIVDLHQENINASFVKTKQIIFECLTSTQINIILDS